MQKIKNIMLEMRTKDYSFFPVHVTHDELKEKYQKKPTVAWGEFQRRTPTVMEIEQWSGEDFNALGFVTGKKNGITVIDSPTGKIWTV